MAGGNWVRNRSVDMYVQEARFRCPHREHGCDHRAPLSAMRVHIEACAFRVVECPCANGTHQGTLRCEWRGPRNGLADHLKNVDHSAYIIMQLHQQETCARSECSALKNRLAAIERSQTEASERGARHDAQLAELKRTLDVVKESNCNKISLGSKIFKLVTLIPDNFNKISLGFQIFKLVTFLSDNFNKISLDELDSVT